MYKILLVEDNEANRDMLSRRLRRHGYEIVCAVDGPDGIAKAASSRPDLILMDIALGEMDGWEAIRIIRSSSEIRDIPIIVLTAHALAADRNRSAEMGCAGFETKPVDLPRLLYRIERALAPRSACTLTRS
ncbi:response regulator [Devosia submarina]|uniref:response regulator n=1 Tax=Devosia submarina TaxID=1173082 RepID=UPI000D38389D|nr:response regulator [Devosia submarina]